MAWPDGNCVGHPTAPELSALRCYENRVCETATRYCRFVTDPNRKRFALLRIIGKNYPVK